MDGGHAVWHRVVSLVALDDSSGPRGGSSRSGKGKHYVDGFKFNFFRLEKMQSIGLAKKSVMFFPNDGSSSA